MAPKAQKEPSWVGGQQRALGPTNTLLSVHLRPSLGSKELEYWLRWPQDFTAFTTSVNRPQHRNSS